MRPISNRKRHVLPPFLVDNEVTERVYLDWLNRKAATHKQRDRKRGFLEVTGAKYRNEIHEAVLRSDGRDAYTGELLDWSLISKYNNDASKEGRHNYKAAFAMLPTVDHVEASARTASFVICAWRTNDAKNDLGNSDFLELCEKVLLHAGYIISPPTDAFTKSSC
jgi:hypothetical protein